MYMTNEIIIRSVYGKVNQTYFIQPCPNPKTGKLPACVKTVDSHGDMILSEEEVRKMSEGTIHYVPATAVFEIVDGTYFNLNDVVDKSNWEAIEHCNWIAKDRYDRDKNGDLIIDGGAGRYGVADLYVERPGEVTRIKVSKKQLVHRASSYVYEDSESGRIKKCKVLGRNLSTAVTSDVLDFLLEKAEKDPKKVIDLYEGEDWKMHLFILDAVDAGVIRKKDNIFSYDDKMLGGSIEATISFLKDVRYKKLIDSIKRETYPNLLPKSELDELQNSMLEGIPHYNEEDPSDLDSHLSAQEKAKIEKVSKANKRTT